MAKDYHDDVFDGMENPRLDSLNLLDISQDFAAGESASMAAPKIKVVQLRLVGCSFLIFTRRLAVVRLSNCL